MRILTVGHSTRPFDDFVALLRAHGVARVVDIRTIPRSRANPQYDRALPRALRNRRIAYTHLASLGGLRRARADSPNAAWRNASFRGYADYMQTPAFTAALDELLALDGPLVLMCAEAVPWRCHRSLVADALVARGVEVAHIMSPTRASPHRMTSFAKVRGARVTYPAPPPARATARGARTSRARPSRPDPRPRARARAVRPR